MEYLIHCPRFTGDSQAVVNVEFDVITHAPKYWRSFENGRLQKLFDWLERKEWEYTYESHATPVGGVADRAAGVLPDKSINDTIDWYNSNWSGRADDSPRLDSLDSLEDEAAYIFGEGKYAAPPPVAWPEVETGSPVMVQQKESNEKTEQTRSEKTEGRDSTSSTRREHAQVTSSGSQGYQADRTPGKGSANQSVLAFPAPAKEETLTRQVILGPAGSGKSTKIREQMELDPHYAVCAATTGVAAINLGPGVTTIHSLLGFYDYQSALQAFRRGRITNAFLQLARAGFHHVNIDEVSMLGADLFELIDQAASNAADAVARGNVTRPGDGDDDYQQVPVTQPVGLILTGDFLQLPPVNAKYLFQSPVWEHYAPAVTSLTTIYRQTDARFLEALKAARSGNGSVTGARLKQCGVEFATKVDYDFEGIALYPTNASVDKHNRERLARIASPEVVFSVMKWGKEAPEWSTIPDELILKTGATVMCLSNDHDAGRVNGDLAVVQSAEDEMARDGFVTVKLQRNDTGHVINYITRCNISYAEADSLAEEFKTGYSELHRAMQNARRDPATIAKYMEYRCTKEMNGAPWYDPDKEGTVIGEIMYLPLRIGYACTINKAQGLTLDAIQICCDNKFAGNPGAMYTALTRCKTPGGIRVVVSDMGRFARRVVTSPYVRQFV